MKVLEFSIEQQLCSEWCWAAVTAAICSCYGDENAPDQRAVVDMIVGGGAGSGCGDCQKDPSLPCNTPWSVIAALADSNVRHAGASSPFNQFSDVVTQIAKCRPIVVEVALEESAASIHAIVIYGYSDDGKVLIADPMRAGDKISVDFGQLRASNSPDYHATWQTAYRTLPK